MKEPNWSNLNIPKIDFQDISYYSAPKKKKMLKSIDEVDPELIKTFEKLGISLQEQKRLSGVAVDAVIDSVSIGTTFKDKLSELGIIFCSFSEAVKEHPELVRKHLGKVVPSKDNKPLVLARKVLLVKPLNKGNGLGNGIGSEIASSASGAR